MSNRERYSLYEFMRTWRSKAKHILKTAAEYETVAPRKKKKFLQQVLDNAEGKHKFVRIAPHFYREQLTKIDDPAFVATIQKYYDGTAGLFGEVSILRVALAKHEVEGKPGFAAEAPGYGRMSYWTGSLYWHLNNKEGYQERVERVELANAFLGIEPDITDEERYGEPACRRVSGPGRVHVFMRQHINDLLLLFYHVLADLDDDVSDLTPFLRSCSSISVTNLRGFSISTA